MRSLGRLIATLALLAACGGGEKGQPRGTSADAPGESMSTARGDANATVSGGKAPCPATGLWTDCAVFDRLDHAGLAPRRDSSAGVVRLPPLGTSGTRLLLGGAQLDAFIYEDAAA